MRVICLVLLLPFFCFSQHVVLNDKEIEQFLSSETGKQLEKAGIAECIRRKKKSPINVNISNATVTSNPPLIMRNYRLYENVSETELSNVTATIHGYEQWENRPTLSGGPLKGEYQLVEVHWEMMDLIMNAFFAHYGHTINGARYDFEIHFVHTLNGLPLEEAKKVPNGVLIVATFITEVAMTTKDIEYFSTNFKGQDMRMIPNETGTPFEWVPPGFFFPDEKDLYFVYNGTFSHPPCEGDVTWILMATPIEMCRFEMQRFLHAASIAKIPFSAIPGMMYVRRDHNLEVLFNFPTKQVPVAVPLVTQSSWHREVLSGIGLAVAAVAIGVAIIAFAYRHYGQQAKNYDVNFQVGFDNINFLNQNQNP